MPEKIYTQEAIKSQVPPSSEVLNQVAEPIDPEAITNTETRQIVDRMFQVAYGRQGDAKYPTLVGLAAPQIGISKRIVIIGMNAVGGGEQPELKAFINPVIIDTSKKRKTAVKVAFQPTVSVA